METQNKQHPSTLHLAALALGKLKPEAAVIVQSHLTECDECKRYVAETSRAELTEVVRLAKMKAAAEQNTQVTGLSQTVSGIPPSAQDQRSAATTPPPTTPSSVRSPVAHAVGRAEIPPDLFAQTKYRITRLLGRGGMGTVYEAEHVRMKRKVALKVINPELMNHPQALARFEEEVKLIASLDHPNIARAFDAETFGTVHTFALEFLDGQNLYDALNARGPMSVMDACRCMRQALLGLEHAHKKDLVHRDIKPQNLFLTRENGIVKILDFGLAKAVSENRQTRGLTTANAVMGTFEYMAPEQARDAAKADIRADIYSIGCTLYYLLSGRLPFQYDQCTQLLLAHQNEIPRPLHEVCPKVPKTLSDIVAKMLAKNPNDRPQTPLAAADLILPFAQGRPSSKPAAVPTRLAKATAAWKELEPRARMAIAAGLLGVVLFGAWASGIVSVRTKSGTIVIENLPADATATIDGEHVKLTYNGENASVESVPTGEHRLKIMLNDLEIASNDVTVGIGGEPVRIRINADDPVGGVEPLAVSESSPTSSSSSAQVAPIAKAAPTPKWPYFEEKTPRFQQLDSKALEAIQADRKKTLDGLPEFELQAVLQKLTPKGVIDSGFGDSTSPLSPYSTRRSRGERPGSIEDEANFSRRRASPVPKSSTAADSLSLPARFVVHGYFSQMRVVNGVTYVSLRQTVQLPDWNVASTPAELPSRSFGPGRFVPGQSYGPGAPPFGPSSQNQPTRTQTGPTHALFSFEGAGIAESFSDVTDGMPMNVVVNRSSDSDLTSYMMSTMQVTSATHYTSPPTVRSVPMGTPQVWTPRAEAIEKSDDPSSWANPKTNVMRRLANREELAFWPMHVARNLSIAAGIKGRIIGRLQRVTKLTSPSAPTATIPTVAHIQIDSGDKFPMIVEAVLGTNVREADFADYDSGEQVEAGVQLTDLIVTILSQSGVGYSTLTQVESLKQSNQYETYPLVTPAGFRAQCTWIQKRDDDSSRVTPAGRSVLPQRLSAKVTPAEAALDARQAVGKKIEWIGKIDSIKSSSAGTHVVIDLKNSKGLTTQIRKVDAFTDSPNYVDELDDYKCDSDHSDGVPDVIVKGTILSADESGGFSKGATPIRLQEIQRVNESGSRAAVGQKRKADSFDPDWRVSGIAKMSRALPAQGSEVKFNATFKSFSEYNHEVSLSEPGERYRTSISVTFERASKTDFIDYYDGANVEVSARVRHPDANSHRSNLTFTGLRIIRRGNQLSEITEKGRTIPAREFIVEKERWSKLKYGRKESNGETALISAAYSSYSMGGDYVSLKLGRVFNDSDEAVIICRQAVKQVRAVLDKLQPGDELVCVVAIEVNDYSPTFHLRTLARLDEPDRVLLGTDASKTRNSGQ